MIDSTAMGANAGRRFWQSADFWAPVFLVTLGILFFSDPLFSSKNFYFRDILNFHYPLRRVLIDSYARGEFPLWNPFVYLGQPMLANPNYMAFYPTNLLHLFLPFNYAFKLHFILHPLLAGPGIYLLQRRLGLRPAAAIAGSIAYQFSGTLLSFLNLYNIVPAVALLPWIGWAFLGALEGKQLPRALLFGVLLGIQAIAFEPLIFQCCLLLLSGLSLYRLLESDCRIRTAASIFRVGLIGGLFAFGLGSIQILPTLELMPRSARGAGFDFMYLSGWSAHPMDLLNSVLPNLFGYPYTMGFATSWGESFHEGREGYLVSFFLGTTTLLFACLSFLTLHKKLQRVIATLAIIGIAFALGRYDPIYRWLVEHIPAFRLGRFPSKYFLVATLAIAILASLGVEVLLKANESGRRKRRQIILVAVLGLVVSAVFLGCYAYIYSQPDTLEGWLRAEAKPELAVTKDFSAIRTQVTRSVLSSGIFLLICSTLIIVAPLRRSSLLMTALPLILLGAELIPPNLQLTPLISGADVDFQPQVNTYIRQNNPGKLFRVLPPTPLMLQAKDLQVRAPNRAAAWLTLFYRRSGQPFYGLENGIQYALCGSVDHLETAESADLWKAYIALGEPAAVTLLEKLNTPMILYTGSPQDARPRYLCDFDTRSNVNLSLYRLESSLPRAYFVPNVEVARSREESLRRFLDPGFSFRNTVVIDSASVIERAGLPIMGEARILSYQNQSISCEVDAMGAGYLVLLDSHYPGWIAYLDGARTEIMRANYAFRAVAVPAGRHRIDFQYRPKSFYLGATISALSLLLSLTLLFLGLPKKRSVPDPCGDFSIRGTSTARCKAPPK